ncbi:MAG: alpha/beta hydrolase [Pseudomonadota bacterium]
MAFGAILTVLAMEGAAAASLDAVELLNREVGAEVFASQMVQVNGRELHAVTGGHGELVLFVHGFPSFWYHFHDQMIDLVTDYQVVAIDALGAGASEKPSETDAYAISDLAAQLDGVASAFAGDEPFFIVGHDWGGALVLAFAEDRPDRLKGAVSLAAPPFTEMLKLLASSPEQRARSGYIERFGDITYDDIVDGPVSETLFEISYRANIDAGELSTEEGRLFERAITDPDALYAGMNWYRANFPSFDKIDEDATWPSADVQLNVPALIIWGENDPVFVPETWQSLGKKGPDVAIEAIAGSRHWLTFEDPSEVNAALRRFFERRKKAEPSRN